MIAGDLGNPTLAQIRSAIQTTLGAEIGQYQRPGLANTAAIWIGRNVPADYKVVVAAPTQTAISSLEVIIDDHPEYVPQPSNLGFATQSERWRIWLIFHDDRQSPRPAIDAIQEQFGTLIDISHLPANKQIPNQYQILIENKRILKQLRR